ncbi:MAG: tyrosine-protein phosphatase [Kiritimatiellia bacterium]
MTACSLLLSALTLLSPENGASVSVRQPVRLAWRGETNVVYLLNLAREGGSEQMFAVSNRTSVHAANLELGSRYDWQVRQAGTLDSASGTFTTADDGPRPLWAEGVGNFRDLGGWRTESGRRVRQGRILLSAALWQPEQASRGAFSRPVQDGLRLITDEGIATMRSEFGVRTDLNLRKDRGGSRADVSALGEGVAWRSVPFESGDRIDRVTCGRESFARILDVLTVGENYPVLIEGGDGRDRVDTLAFLLNGLLGVSEPELRRGWTSSPELYRALVAYLRQFPGETMRARIEAYAHGCGIADRELAAFRALALE